MVYRALRQAKGSNRPFGGILVILVGDPAQLPPVLDSPLYSSNNKKTFSNKGTLAYSQFKKVIILNQLQRQVVQEGDERQRLYVQTLSSIRNGVIKIEDWQFLNSLSPRRNARFQSTFGDAIRLSATNGRVYEYNSFKIQQLEKPITRLVAINHPPSARKYCSENFRGLQNDLFLCVGSKVTLVTNLLPNNGLTNGS